MIRSVPNELIPDVWPIVAPMLDKALKVHPFLNITDLLWLLNEQRAALVIDFDERILGAAVMEVIQYPSIKVSNVVALGGEIGFMANGLNDLLDYCEQWAQERHCRYFSMIGRPGWSNFIPKRGGQSLKLIQGWKQLETPCRAAERSLAIS